MAKIMDPILPVLSILGYWAIILGSFGGPGSSWLGSVVDILTQYTPKKELHWKFQVYAASGYDSTVVRYFRNIQVSTMTASIPPTVKNDVEDSLKQPE